MVAVSETERAAQRRYIAWKKKTIEYNLRRVGMTLDDVPWIRGKPNSPQPR